MKIQFENPEEELNAKKKELIDELNKKKKGYLGCLISLLIILIIFLGSMIYVSHLPSFQPLMQCVKNEIEIYNAVSRYKDVNNAYPDSLKDISEDYLQDKNILYCPLDKNHEGYEYNNPDKKSDKKYILRCKRHRLNENQIFPPVIITLDGNFAYDMEEFEKNTINK